MLVLRRRENERITITSPSGEVITVVLIKSGIYPKIGIEAPATYKVLRAELKDGPTTDRTQKPQRG